MTSTTEIQKLMRHKWNKMNFLKNLIKAYPARGPKYIDLKESVSKNTNKFYEGWKKIVYGFKNGVLPLSKKGGMKTDSGNQRPSILEDLMIFYSKLKKSKNI